MPSTTVRISERTRDIIRQLTARTGESMREVLEKAVENYRRQRFLEEANRAYAALKNNPKAWKEELEERRAWDATLVDGLEDE